ncbi:MAG: hypothetical protein LQ339_008532 [Xanthoria mediterranea]|nr:MAG: hypothetical protein LQ339_008532 [Xanthoria mediterranea]
MRLSGACWLSLGTGALAHPRVSPGSQYVRRQSGPVPPDTIKDCTYFYDSQPGDTCASIASGWGVTLQEFVTYNPSVKTDCSGLVVGSSYCVEQNYGNGPSNPVTTSSTATSEHSTTTTSPAPTEPTPVQSGISSQCKQYYKVQDGDTCAGIVNKYHTFTLADFYSWNPAVGSNCETLFVEYFVCIGIPGTPTAPPTTTSAGATPGPSPTQSGLVTTCKSFYKVQDGDYCEKIVNSYGTFSLADFYTWNPAIGTNCGSLFVNYYVCVGVPGTPTTRRSSATASTTSTTPTGPTPTQPGIISSCTKYYKTVSGDTCQVISDKFGTFSVSQFESWNPAVKSDCSQLYLDYYYCIAVPGTPTTRSTTSTTKTTSTASSGPSPTQTGIISSCTKYYKTVAGDTCQVLSDRYGTFSVAQFVTWNPAVKPDCSLLFLGYYYCIAIPGTPTTRTSTSTANSPPSPTPTPKGPQSQQPGIVGNCYRYYKVASGDSCYTIEQAQKVSASNFQKWNTGIKSDCSNLFVGYYVCTGVP